MESVALRRSLVSTLFPHSHDGAVRLDAVHMAIEPVKQEGIAFSLRERKLFASFFLHEHVEVCHEHAASNGDIHGFRNAVLRELEFVISMGQRIGMVAVELASEVESHRLAQIEVEHGVRGIRTSNSNLVTFFTELFHAEHALLVQIKAHPLVRTFKDRLVHAISIVFFDDVNILNAKDFCRADDSRYVVRIEQVFEHHAKVPCTAVYDRSQQFTAAFSNAGKQRFQILRFTHSLILFYSN